MKHEPQALSKVGCQNGGRGASPPTPALSTTPCSSSRSHIRGATQQSVPTKAWHLREAAAVERNASVTSSQRCNPVLSFLYCPIQAFKPLLDILAALTSTVAAWSGKNYISYVSESFDLIDEEYQVLFPL